MPHRWCPPPGYGPTPTAGSMPPAGKAGWSEPQRFDRRLPFGLNTRGYADVVPVLAPPRHDRGMRLASLLPVATEIVYALGLGEDLVG